MSGSVFVVDHNGTPMMPMAAAYARRLLTQKKAKLLPHHAFTVIQLTQVVVDPVSRPVTMLVHIGLNIAEIVVIVQTRRNLQVLMRLVVDLRSDISWRMRRRAGHRRRRRSRGRYRAMRQHGRPFKLRRPSLAVSAWAKQHWNRQTNVSHRKSPSAIIQWRAQAVYRVIQTVQSWLPLSTIAVLLKHHVGEQSTQPQYAQKKAQRLQQHHAEQPEDEAAQQRCAYCGTQRRRLVIDHVVPQSRGGTDALSNLVFACQPCNIAKGDRTPEEAGMPLLHHSTSTVWHIHQTKPYITQTKTTLEALLQSGAVPIRELSHSELAPLQSVSAMSNTNTPTYIAKPIARPIKQRFTSRNYSQKTTIHGNYVRHSTTVKRRTRVNLGIIVRGLGKQRKTSVIKIGDTNAEQGQVIRLGLLCSGERSGTKITGIVGAIHSSGRVTLVHPHEVNEQRVQWQRTVVSPNQAFRIISTDRVVFFMMPVSTTTHLDGDES